MRIISGIYRGRRLNPPKLRETRPTTDFAREGLFNMLTHMFDFPETSVLDLYSGTGAIAIEFLSRGANKASAVDSNRQSVKFMASVKSEWGIENLEIIKGDCLKFLSSIHRTYDLIFADPPYLSDDAISIVELVHKKKVLNPDGMLIVEHDKHKNLSDLNGFKDMRSFGKVNFSFFTAL